MRKKSTRAVQCPGCNTSFQIMDRTAPGALVSYAPAPKPPPDEHLVRAVIAPMRQSLISAGYAAVASGAIVGLTEHVQLWPQVALLSGALCGGMVWALAAWDDNQLRWKVEAALGIDLDGDGQAGEPEQKNDTIETDITVNERRLDGKISRIITLKWPCRDRDIPAIAQRLLNGQLAQADWGKGTLLSVPKFKKVAASLIKAGYGEWNNPTDHTKGWHLTVSGRVFLGEKPPTYPAG